MRVLFAASEIFPHAKSGGLADVANALPFALHKHVDIFSVMPLYGFMDKKTFKKEKSLKIKIGRQSFDIQLYTQEKDGVKTYFIEAQHLSTTQHLYCDENGDYPNNDLRFAIFCSVIVELALALKIDIVHLNDWHTALTALYIKERKLKIQTVFTIHNLAYQGLFEKSSLATIGVDKKYFTMDALEFYGKVNLLKAGISFSDHVTTVSPSYAKEILTKEFGCGLEGFLSYHKEKLSGILNGINDVVYNSHDDTYIDYPFDKNSLENKYKNKLNFISNSTLKDPRKPLFVMITRLVEQKGIDLVMQSLKEILAKKLNFYILGEGSKVYVDKLTKLSAKYDNFEFISGYNEKLSHQAYASADFLLMPSKFEPCGLNQMICMRYGTIPIVHAVGGLKDSVHQIGPACGNGIVYQKQSKKELLNAVDEALDLKKDTKKLQKLIVHNMECDLSFGPSALEYIKVYKKILQ